MQSLDNNDGQSTFNCRLSESQSFINNSNSSNSEETVVNLGMRKKGLNMGFLNVQGISSKFSEIEILLTAKNNENVHVFSMCETKLNSRKLTSAFKIPGFHLPFRKDNHTNGGGGILVYVKDHIITKRREDLELNDIACSWLEFRQIRENPFYSGLFIEILQKGLNGWTALSNFVNMH